MATTKVSKKFPAKAMPPPNLSMAQWNLTMLLGLVFVVMAVLQLIGFSGFKAALNSFGLSSPTTWAIVLIILELWGASSFFKLPLSYAFRMTGSLFAVVVAAFWFYETIGSVSGGGAGILPNSGFFGRFLQQSPGWWTVVEASVVVVWTLWAVGLTKAGSTKQ